MEYKRAIEILKTEKECVQRASQCDRDCASCDLLLADDEILDAYDMAIRLMNFADAREETINRQIKQEREYGRLTDELYERLDIDLEKECPSDLEMLRRIMNALRGSE